MEQPGHTEEMLQLISPDDYLKFNNCVGKFASSKCSVNVETLLNKYPFSDFDKQKISGSNSIKTKPCLQAPQLSQVTASFINKDGIAASSSYCNSKSMSILTTIGHMDKLAQKKYYYNESAYVPRNKCSSSSFF